MARVSIAWRFALKAAISAALLAWLLSHTPLAEIRGVLARLDPLPVAAGMALAVATWWLSAVRLWLLAREFPFGQVARMTFVGMYYGTVLPGQVAGDVVKAYRLSSVQTAPGLAAAATFVDRVVAMIGLLVTCAIAAPWVRQLPSRLAPAITTAAAACVLGLALASHRRVRSVFFEASSAATPGLRGLAARFGSGLNQVLERRGRLASNFAIAMGFHAVCVAIQVILGAALGIELPVAAWCVTYAGVSLLTLLPVSIAGLGMREGGYVGLLGLFGIPASQALSLSLLIFAYAIVGALAGMLVEISDRSNSAR